MVRSFVDTNSPRRAGGLGDVGFPFDTEAIVSYRILLEHMFRPASPPSPVPLPLSPLPLPPLTIDRDGGEPKQPPSAVKSTACGQHKTFFLLCCITPARLLYALVSLGVVWLYEN